MSNVLKGYTIVCSINELPDGMVFLSKRAMRRKAKSLIKRFDEACQNGDVKAQEAIDNELGEAIYKYPNFAHVYKRCLLNSL